ncbi:Lrp/AsnC family transcriptional regulator [Pontibaca salina]|uniref:AsnC family transcriptional regulator n=1 Tax=Pontibaca salina TaxID=2795731 RepID=A0A934HWL2_9RHOB|nr:AsnC family transcriptional regulator [Pontibaca salina]MBI6630849.1 AsnC family transcriptional regulator [Pontibaca salina]
MSKLEKAAAPQRNSGKALLGDKLNRRIISMLREDGRMAFSEMAQALDVSEGTIRNRVNSMKASGTLHIAALTDPKVSEYQTEAMLGLRVAANCQPKQVAERLEGIDEVVYIAWVSGRYDMLVEVLSDGEGALVKLLETHIYGKSDIVDVEVMTRLKNFKNQFLLKRNWS